MSDIQYKIEFHTDWHCGSGLAAGADVDALVVKDARGLPFVPGKTMKGIVREVVEELCLWTSADSEWIRRAFGTESVEKGTMFFSNAELEKAVQDAIADQQLGRFIYRTIANTAIDKCGMAKPHSLRKMEVVAPCTLVGCIRNAPEENIEEIVNALRGIKRLGQNRNRGLGRCTITVNKGGAK